MLVSEYGLCISRVKFLARNSLTDARKVLREQRHEFSFVGRVGEMIAIRYFLFVMLLLVPFRSLLCRPVPAA